MLIISKWRTILSYFNIAFKTTHYVFCICYVTLCKWHNFSKITQRTPGPGPVFVWTIPPSKTPPYADFVALKTASPEFLLCDCNTLLRPLGCCLTINMHSYKLLAQLTYMVIVLIRMGRLIMFSVNNRKQSHNVCSVSSYTRFGN